MSHTSHTSYFLLAFKAVTDSETLQKITQCMQLVHVDFPDCLLELHRTDATATTYELALSEGYDVFIADIVDALQDAFEGEHDICQQLDELMAGFADTLPEDDRNGESVIPWPDFFIGIMDIFRDTAQLAVLSNNWCTSSNANVLGANYGGWTVHAGSATYAVNIATFEGVVESLLTVDGDDHATV